MTKSWYNVRSQICRLYSQGHSLEHIRKTLKTEYGFEASTRAYRLKLRAWRARHLDEVSASERDSGPVLDRRMHPAQEMGSSAPNLNSEEPLIPSGTDKDPTAHQTSPNALYSLRLRNYSADKLEQVYILLKHSISHPIRVDIIEQYLGSDDFIEGRTSLLHFSIKEVGPAEPSISDVGVVRAILSYMEKHSISNELRDLQDRTALDLAMEKDSASLTSTILDYMCSASFFRRSTFGSLTDPLHKALSLEVSPCVIRLLLAKGADPNSGESGRKPLDSAMRRLYDRCGHSAVSCIKPLETASLLIAHGAKCKDGDLAKLIGYFVHHWLSSSGMPHGQQRDTKHPMMDHEILLNCSRPILQAYLDQNLASAELYHQQSLVLACHHSTLLHVAIAHSIDCTLIDMILEQPKHAERYVEVAMHVLSWRHCVQRTIQPATLAVLDHVLYRALPRIVSDHETNLLLFALGSPSRLSPGAHLVRTILKLRPQDTALHRASELVFFVKRLNRWDFKLGLEIAEQVFDITPCEELEKLLLRIRAAVSGDIGAFDLKEQIAAFMPERHECKDKGVDSLVLGALHTVTKRMMKTLALSEAQDIAYARILALRRRFGLPDLSSNHQGWLYGS